MTATATLNVRLPEDLKEHGMQVLERENMSVSDVVRSLFRELEWAQRLPDFARRDDADEEEEVARRHASLRGMVGITPTGIDLEDAFIAYAAARNNVDFIVTRNKRGFSLSPVPALAPRQFVDLCRPRGVTYDDIELTPRSDRGHELVAGSTSGLMNGSPSPSAPTRRSPAR